MNSKGSLETQQTDFQFQVSGKGLYRRTGGESAEFLRVKFQWRLRCGAALANWAILSTCASETLLLQPPRPDGFKLVRRRLACGFSHSPPTRSHSETHPGSLTMSYPCVNMSWV